jgi:hypothetical protein
MSTNDLFDFMKAITSQLSAEYDRIQRRATEDPGTAGDQGEENWATILREWLPHSFHIVTKGRILSTDGKASGQVDVIVLSPAYPRFMLDKKLYLAGGVAAAFECKTTLKASHIREAVENAATIRRLMRPRVGSPYKELHSPLIYGLLAHSHSWKGAASTPLENVEAALREADAEKVAHPREMLDLLCIADLATWVSNIGTFLGPNQVPLDWRALEATYGPEGSATTAYMQHSPQVDLQKPEFQPIGPFLNYLFRKLAREHDALRNLSDYFRLADLGGSGRGYMRCWPSSIYSDVIRQRVVAGALSNGVPWDEWSVHF